MTEFTVNGVRYIGVEVPEGCNKFWVTGNFLQMYPYKDGDIKLRNLPAGNYEIVGLCKDLSWDERCELRGLKNTYYDQTVIGRDMVEFDITHYNVEFDDWLQFKRMHNLTNNTLILKIITNG